MQAWQIAKHGGNEVVQRVQLPTPEAGPGQVRIKVQAVGLNHLDLWVRNGVEGHRFPLPLIPGCDIAGVVDQLGPGTQEVLAREQIKVGTAVVLNSGVSCGRCEACLSGNDPLCPQYGILGETQDGGCADYVIVRVANVIAIPAGLTLIQAAALPIPYLTAWNMLTRKAQLRAGETVLVQAGGSGVSVAAIQMAKLLGATVITTVGSDDKIKKARDLGADFVIQYKKNPFRDELKKVLGSLGKKGCEVIIDHVGADTLNDSIKSLAWGGRLVTCGATSGSQVNIDLKAIFFKNISILGSTMGSKADLIRIVQLVAAGKLKAVTDSVMPMDQYPQALAKLESRNVFGKVIVTQ